MGDTINVTVVTDDINFSQSNDYYVNVVWANPADNPTIIKLQNPTCGLGVCTFQSSFTVPNSAEWIYGGTYTWDMVFIKSGYLEKHTRYTSAGSVDGTNWSNETHSFTVLNLVTGGQ